ncbi:MAG: hypothetical protein CV087_11645 [Candidatus Brocadia sp. WS118]|nr:MAG: hypothetical protein CV087_11645 [Candidatus Brocadia sp. WS118]
MCNNFIAHHYSNYLNNCFKYQEISTAVRISHPHAIIFDSISNDLHTLECRMKRRKARKDCFVDTGKAPFTMGLVITCLRV